jgi:hypothetical protein
VPLSTEQVKNRPLNGAEVRQYAVSLLEKVLRDHCRFQETISYGRVAFEIEARFHFGDSSRDDVVVHTFTKPNGVIEGEPPLALAGEQAEAVALDISTEVTNPNLVRVATDIPIEIRSKPVQKPGDMFPRIETHAVKYDKEQYPEPEPPVVTDKSAETGEFWKRNPKPDRRKR